jgi:hypothetical protein
MEVRDERTRFAHNLDVHFIALHVSDDEQDETGIGPRDAPGGGIKHASIIKAVSTEHNV